MSVNWFRKSFLVYPGFVRIKSSVCLHFFFSDFFSAINFFFFSLNIRISTLSIAILYHTFIFLSFLPFVHSSFSHLLFVTIHALFSQATPTIILLAPPSIFDRHSVHYSLHIHAKTLLRLFFCWNYYFINVIALIFFLLPKPVHLWFFECIQLCFVWNTDFRFLTVICKCSTI